MNNVLLTINGCDTSRPLDTWFELFASSLRDTKYHQPCGLYLCCPSLLHMCIFIKYVAIPAHAHHVGANGQLF